MEHILFQLDIGWQLFLYHTNNLTDQEAYWCMTEKGLQIKENNGAWSADWPETEDYKIGPTSIAWTMWHMIFWWEMVFDYSFGEAVLTKEKVLWPGNTEKAIKSITSLHDKWVERIKEMTPHQLASSQSCKWPFTGYSFYDLALWLNSEFMKNAAEIGAGRFLYAAFHK